MSNIDALLITPPSRLEVYQGLANDIPKEEIDKIHEFALKKCEPDVTILLDIPFETGI